MNAISYTPNGPTFKFLLKIYIMQEIFQIMPKIMLFSPYNYYAKNYVGIIDTELMSIPYLIQNGSNSTLYGLNPPRPLLQFTPFRLENLLQSCII